LAIAGNNIYLAYARPYLLISDVTTPSDPVELGRFNSYDRSFDIRIVGNYAYMGGWFEEGIKIFDINDPSNPVIENEFFVEDYGRDLEVYCSHLNAWKTISHWFGLISPIFLQRGNSQWITLFTCLPYILYISNQSLFHW